MGVSNTSTTEIGGTLTPALTADTSFDNTPGVDYGAYALDAATVSAGGIEVEGGYTVDLLAGALWQIDGLGIGQLVSAGGTAFGNGYGTLTIDGGGADGGTLDANGAIQLGANPLGQLPVVSGGGALAAIDGSSIAADGLSMQFASVSIDATSSVVLGQATATDGALTVAAGATLEVSVATIFGDLVDNGSLKIDPWFFNGSIPGKLTVTGNIMLGGSMTFDSNSLLDVGGTLTLLDGGSLVVAGSPRETTGALAVEGGVVAYMSLEKYGAIWATGALTIGAGTVPGGSPGHGSLVVQGYGGEVGGGFLQVGGAIVLGQDPGPAANGFGMPGIGTLAVNAVVTAASLAVLNGSTVSVGASGSLLLGTGTVTNGAISVGAGATFYVDIDTVNANVIDDGTLVIGQLVGAGSGGDANGSLGIVGNLDAEASIALGGNALHVSGNATVEAGVAIVAGGSFSVGGTLSGTGTLDVFGSATIDAVSSGPTIELEASGTLVLSGNSLSATVGLHVGASIDFLSLSSDQINGYGNGGVYEFADPGFTFLEVTAASGQVEGFALAGSPDGLQFVVSADGHGGTLLQVLSSPQPLTATTPFDGFAYADFGSFALDAATLSVGSLDINGSYTVDLLAGALWQTGAIGLGQATLFNGGGGEGNGSLTIDGGGTDGGTLNVDGDITVGIIPDSRFTSNSGALAVINGGSVYAGGLSLRLGNIMIDATSIMVLGQAPATAGALTVGTGASLDIGGASVNGDLIDSGSMSFDPVQLYRGSSGLSVNGDFTLMNSFAVNTDDYLFITGTLAVLDGGDLSLLGQDINLASAQVSGAIVLGQDANSVLGALAVPSAGTLTESDSFITAGGLSLLDGSLISVDASSILLLGASSAVSEGAITVGGDATLLADVGTIDASVTLEGTLTLLPLAQAGGGATQGALTISGDLTFSGTTDVASLTMLDVGGTLTVATSASFAVDGGTLVIGTLAGSGIVTLSQGASARIEAVSGTPTINFGAGDATLTLAGTGTLGLNIEGLHAGDTIDVTGISSVGGQTAHAEMADGTLDVTGASGQTASLALSGPTPNLQFIVSAEGHGGTLVRAVAPALTAGTSFEGTANVNNGTFVLDGGTVSADPSDIGVEGDWTVQLLNGARWQAYYLDIGDDRFNDPTPAVEGSLTLQGMGTLSVGLGIRLGQDPNLTTDPTLGHGNLTAIDGATVLVSVVGSGSSLGMYGGSSVVIDATSSVVVGQATATAGALTIGGVGTLFSMAGTLAGNVIDYGQIVVDGEFGYSDSIFHPGNLVVSGNVSAEAYITVGGGSTFDVAGGVSLAAAAVVDVGGVLSAGTLSGVGTLTLESGGVVSLQAVAGAPTIEFFDGTASVSIGQAGATGLVLRDMFAGDSIDFTGVSSTPNGSFGAGSAVVVDGVLQLTGASGETASLTLTDPASLIFTVIDDGSGGTLVQASASAAAQLLTAATTFDRTPSVDYGTYTLDAATVADGSIDVEGGYTVDLLAGALWQAGAINIGQAIATDLSNFVLGRGTLTVSGGGANGGTLNANGKILLGTDPSFRLSLPPSGFGSLAAIDGSSILASGLSVQWSGITIDATSSVVLGQATATQGALTVGVGATLDVTNGAVSGNLIDSGSIVISGWFGQGQIPGALNVSGDFTLTGSLFLDPYGELIVGGALTVLDGGDLALEGDISVTGAIVLGRDINSTSGALDVPNAGTLTDEVGRNYAGGLSLYDGSLISMGPFTSLWLGHSNILSFNGIIVGGDATLSADIGTIEANVIVEGTLALLPLPQAGGGATQGALTISGDLTFSGTTDVASLTMLDVGGTLTVATSASFAVDGGTLVAGTLAGGGIVTLSQGASATIEAVSGTPTINFGAGDATLTLAGTGTLGLTIEGLHAGDTIDLVDVSSVPSGSFGTGGAAASGGSLDVTGASGEGASLTLSGVAPGLVFTVTTDGAGGTLVAASAPCYAAGTRILAEHGEVPVEALRPGDRVRTLAGRLAPVTWVGQTRIDLARHPHPERAAPIRVAANAIAPGVPHRDLLLSPEHALFLDGALLPVWQLANGATIARQDGLASITYVHVELDRHDILLAEGAAAESYLDTGNRGLFDNAAGARPLHPEFAVAPDAAALRVWAEQAAAPLLLGGDAVAAVRARLLARAGPLGWACTDDPALTVMAGGVALPATRAADGGWRVEMPAGTRSARLRCRSFVPAELAADSGDTRRLGLAVAALLHDGQVAMPDARADGWHAADDAGWRWTDGNGHIALTPAVRAWVLEVRIAFPGRYWVAAPDRLTKAA